MIDSTDGNVMLEKPEYYFKLEIEGTKWIRAYSEYPLPGFIKMERKTVSPWYATVDITNSVAVSGCWLTWNGDEIARDSDGFVILKANAAQFRGGSGAGDAAKDGTYNSMLGMPRTSISKAGVRPLCKNGTHHGAYRVYNEIAWLQRVEYASLHCQDAYTETLTADGFHQGGLGSGRLLMVRSGIHGEVTNPLCLAVLLQRWETTRVRCPTPSRDGLVAIRWYK